METIGYNIEWSQELSVAQSLEEYVKAWIIIELLKRWEPLREFVGDDPGPHVFDMSVGYDLAGIQSDKVAGFIDAMHDASDEIERLRAQIPADSVFAEFRDIEIASHISDTITLSHLPRLPSGRDRGDHEAPDRAPRHRRDREAQSDAARPRRRERDRHEALGYE